MILSVRSLTVFEENIVVAVLAKLGLGQHFQDQGHSFTPYGPPSRQITYIYNKSGRGF